ncbi:MAG: stage II sporulation protein P [Firmicutes bacterium]|nr:stage II sporulation protein P [Bacillota bacterium]
MYFKITTVFICLCVPVLLVYCGVRFFPRRTADAVTAPAQFYELAPASLSTANIEDYAPRRYDINAVSTIPQLMQYIYAVDKKTIMTDDLFDVKALLSTDCHIKRQSEAPLVLIFHTHPNELYADSAGKAEGVCGAGERLKTLLEQKYGIKVLHITEDFDMQDGKIQRNGAYERCEPYIRRVLRDNPSIRLCIDLHRDGVSENMRLVKTIDGKSYAKIMFFNGLCQKNEGGKAVGVGLENPYLKQNLALSLKMQLALDEKYPGVSRKIYLNAYRYSLHFMDKSLLIELGAQTNTKAEVNNSIEIIAELIGEVVL